MVETLFLSIPNPSFSVDFGKRFSSFPCKFTLFKSRLLGTSRISPWNFNFFTDTAFEEYFSCFLVISKQSRAKIVRHTVSHRRYEITDNNGSS